MGGGLHRGDERDAGKVAAEPAKLIRRDDDHGFASVYGDVLGTLVVNAPNELAEPSLGILQRPTT